MNQDKDAVELKRAIKNLNDKMSRIESIPQVGKVAAVDVDSFNELVDAINKITNSLKR